MHAPENSAAIEACLSAGCLAVGLDISEIWRREGKTGYKFMCVKVFAAPAAIQEHGDSLIGLAGTDNQGKKHTLSPTLCEKGTRQKVPLWYTPQDAGTPLHSALPIRTAVVVPVFSYEIQQEFLVIFYSLRIIPSSSASMAFLRHVCKAAVVACGCMFVKSVIDAVHRPSVNAEKIGDINVVCTKPQLPNLYVLWTDLQQVERLVDGGSSVIYTAVYSGMGVIVKILREDCERNELRVKEIRGEIEVMQVLNHPNIVQYVASGQEPRTFVVMERLEGGSLNQRLGFVPTHTGVHRQAFFTKDVRKPFSYEALLKYALQFADALRYMHDEAMPGYSVMHRDLKPDNIGFKADGTLKILDFGLAKAIPKNAEEKAKVMMTGETGSMRYMAPEVALHKPYDEKADVYSFSLIVWEMATLTKPFEGYDKEEFFRYVVRGGERPAINKKWPKDFGELLQACWQETHHLRPSSAQVCEAIKVMLAGVQDRSKKARFFLLLDRRSTWF